MAARSNAEEGGLSPVADHSFGLSQTRRFSNSADIAVERPLPTYPMPKKSEGKILRPQYKEILQGRCPLKCGLPTYMS